MKFFLCLIPAVSLIILAGHAPQAHPQGVSPPPKSPGVEELAKKLQAAFAQADGKKPDAPKPDDAGVFKDQELPAFPAKEIKNGEKKDDKKPVAPKPAESPKAASKPKPKPPTGSAPVITVDAPKFVEVGHFIHATITNGGGPIREQEIIITPQPADGDFMYGVKEIIGADGEPLRVEDKNSFAFVAPEGPVTIAWWFIGAETGHQRGETRILVRDSRPAKVAPAEAQGPQQPAELVRKWAGDVPSSDRDAERVIIAAAARKAVKELASKNINDADRAVEEWRNQAFLDLGGAKRFEAWNRDNGKTKSFFSNVAVLFDDASHDRQIKDFDAKNYLEYFATVLEGK